MSASLSSATLPGLAKGPGCCTSVEPAAPTARSISSRVGARQGHDVGRSKGAPKYVHIDNCSGA